MKKRILVIAASLCLIFTCMPQAAGTVFAAEAENTAGAATENVASAAPESQPASPSEGHDCGYERPKGVCLPLPDSAQNQAARKAVRRIASEQETQESISGIKEYGKDKIGKNYLNGLENANNLSYVYKEIASAIDHHASSVKFTWDENSGITDEEADMVYYLVKEDYPEFFWWGNGTYINYVYEGGNKIAEIAFVGEAKDSEGKPPIIANVYTFDTRDEIVAAKAEFDAKVDEIAEQTAGMSEYESELFFHDWIALNTSYDDEDKSVHNHDAFGAIMTGTAVCESYTRAMQVLLNERGIENYTVSGTSKGVGHTWNVVKLDDGQWYQVDVTWDDQGDRESDIFYAYFNITTELMKTDHAIPAATDENFPNYILFECNATEYWYYNQNPDRLVIVGENIDEDDFIAKLEKQFKENIIYARIYAIGDNSTEEALGKLFDESSAKKILESRDYEGTYLPGYSSMGEIEYHFELQYESDIYGYLEQGKVNTNAVTIRFYPYGTEDSVIEQKIQLPVGEGENEDDLCVKEVADIDAEWKDCNDYVNKKYYGTYRKNFSDRLLAGEYVMAVNIEGQGCYSSYIFVGKEATTQDTATENRWLFYDLGDLDDNGVVDTSDAIFLTRYIAEWNSYLKNGNWCAADINDDGIINIVDLTILQRHLAGWKDYEYLEDYENGSKVAADLENAG